jgi:transcriptional regulator with XRE-family HTH domain
MYDPEQECKVMIKNLKRLCKEKNISANALAIEAGISTSTMSYIMNGKSKPYVYTVLMICNVLGVTVSELFEDIELDFNNTGSPRNVGDKIAGDRINKGFEGN